MPRQVSTHLQASGGSKVKLSRRHYEIFAMILGAGESSALTIMKACLVFKTDNEGFNQDLFIRRVAYWREQEKFKKSPSSHIL